MSLNVPSRLLPIAALVAGLSACGGSNSPVVTTTTSGVVTGSYYQSALVCIDTNLNARCDTGETSTRTDAAGAYSLSQVGSGAVVAEIGTDAKRYDPDTKTTTAVTQALVFRAPAQANGVVSALSTELVALMDRGQSFEAARATLATRLGVSADTVLANHNTMTDAVAKGTIKGEIAQMTSRIASTVAAAGTGDRVAAMSKSLALDDDLANVQTVVVIYAENRGFDNLYGLFPGANGVPGVNPSSDGVITAQKDFDGSTLATLPPTWGGLTAAGQTPVITQAETVGWANKPFQIDAAAGVQNTGKVVPQSVITRDLVHRFYNNQMQINGGANDRFTAYSDAGSLSMGYYDGSSMALWKIAQQYTLADNFFMGAFGGSFLNHQYLICACAPEYPNADTATAHPSISAVDPDSAGQFVRLTPSSSNPSSVLNGAPVYQADGTITPKDAAGKFYAVNTMQPPYQPSSNAPASSDSTRLFATTTSATTLPPQTATNIGDLLSAKGVNWAWYAGAWNSTLANATSATRTTFASPPNFQFHHQPFNYFADLDPTTHAADRSAHLRDFDTQFLADAAAGTLPAVTFYKPQGNLNQHAGYADVASGDAHIASVIEKLKQSPQWKNMVVVVTYDENGGFYDHAKVPKADRWGPGTRIPAIIVSPYARKGYVDKTQYDTASILRLITRRFGLPKLAGITQRDQGLIANGYVPMGDLTGALDFAQ
ncbi:acid phosphatase [Xylophilus sp. GOD-11R]|uniref:acid phosphatase n=1 Tax=Xylophilus sp. GOD-11R TaxID=3089814 RepID=UPI00298C06E1|nr:acid phosphatase [Xylophilus sp. GOD-11R]WPB57096.1 acid phosphatase [Xylophilus sp. GOD-11R]